MAKNINYEKLSAYLDGELPLEEKNKFEEELALSSDLQKKLSELKKLKQLTASSIKPLSESPYFETRLFASLKEHKTSFLSLKKLSPIVGFLVLTLAVMIFLKYNPQIIENLVEQQKSNLAGFYKQNLKPLLYAANLSNEDVFNFAFNHQLPLDKTNSQYLQLGYDTTGNGFFEIKTRNIASNVNNLDKFIRALNLNSQQKEKVDSILQNYAEELQSQAAGIQLGGARLEGTIQRVFFSGDAHIGYAHIAITQKLDGTQFIAGRIHHIQSGFDIAAGAVPSLG